MSDNPFMIDAAAALRILQQSRSFIDLGARRGMDFHRRRPQSVLHFSPRTRATVRTETMSTFTKSGELLEPGADADRVHQQVLAAMASLRVAMRDVRRTIPRMIRAKCITYLD